MLGLLSGIGHWVLGSGGMMGWDGMEIFPVGEGEKPPFFSPANE